MKNKREQTFCTWLRGVVLKQQPVFSLLIEAKVEEKGEVFHLSQIRKSQLGTLNKLEAGLPIAYKVADGGVGSKLVDMIYISPQNKRFYGMVAVHFLQSRKKYMFPYELVLSFKDNGKKTIPESVLTPYKL